MSATIVLEALAQAAFEPFGDVLESAGEPARIINQGRCGRWHDLARLTFSDGRVGISLFRSEVRALPFELAMMERHHLGSQAFVPMSFDPFVVVVAPDANGVPGRPRAFLSAPGQGVNYHPGVWHGVLMPLHAPGLFAVIDRIAVAEGESDDVEEHWFSKPWMIVEQP